MAESGYSNSSLSRRGVLAGAAGAALVSFGAPAMATVTVSTELLALIEAHDIAEARHDEALADRFRFPINHWSEEVDRAVARAEAAGEVERGARDRLLGYRPQNMAEVSHRLRYLTEHRGMWRDALPTEEELDLFFGSMMVEA